MNTLYVFDNALLGDFGTAFNSALIDQFDGTEEECLAWFSKQYDGNDYSASFTAP